LAWVLRSSKVLQLQHREHGCITAWYGNCSASDRKALQRVVRMAQYITGAKLPAIQDLYTRRCRRKALKIVKDPSHPSHRLFSLLQHGKRYRSAKSRTKRLLNSFYPQAIRLLNIVCLPQPLFYAAATLCLSYMHSQFNYTFMYIPPQLGRTTSAPAHWLAGLSALCPTTHQPLFHTTATLCSSYMHSHFNHIYMYILPQSA
jgi:hypothetical protein